MAGYIPTEEAALGVRFSDHAAGVKGQPEVRQYRARWRDDDQPFGNWSDIVQVTARP